MCGKLSVLVVVNYGELIFYTFQGNDVFRSNRVIPDVKVLKLTTSFERIIPRVAVNIDIFFYCVNFGQVVGIYELSESDMVN